MMRYLSCSIPGRSGQSKERLDHGRFTDSGYVIRDQEEWQEVYDGRVLPELVPVSDSIVQSIFRCRIKEMDTEKANLLDTKLALLDKTDLLKYKAVLWSESCRDFDMALDLLEQLDRYELEPDCVTPESYCRAFMEAKGMDIHHPAFRRFDFREYGLSLLKQEQKQYTCYGVVKHHRQVMDLESKETNGMEMR